MTEDQFFLEFAKVAKGFRVTTKEEVESVLLCSFLAGKLRLGPATTKTDWVCPICAVFNSVFPNEPRENLNGRRAGVSLRLTHGFISDIVNAADEPVKAIQSPIRQRLLDIIHEANEEAKCEVSA